MFDKVLIANRGEIACRIIRTLRRLRVRSVAVYSEADRNSLHVAQADEAVRLGPAPASESYLRQDALLAAARATGAQAIHPGYGFLSENFAFAQACEAAGIVFIGPTPQQMRDFGLKHPAERLASRSGVPLLPGSGLLATRRGARREAARIGYPVMLKSTAGGGGIGMQLVRRDPSWPTQLRRRRASRQQEFQPWRRVPGALHRARAAYRSADIRRRRGPGDRPGRARLLGAAAQSEAHRGNPGARTLGGAAASACCDCADSAWAKAVQLPIGRHGGIRLRRETTENSTSSRSTPACRWSMA